MKALVIAAGLLAMGVTTASAQGVWIKGRYPYAQRHHKVCQAKAHRLHAFEARAARDGRISRSERATMRVLERDLNATCGGYRFRG